MVDDIIRSFLNLHPDTPIDGQEYAVPLRVVKRLLEAGMKVEREACLEACRMYVDLNEPPEGFQNGVECCIAVITHKDDPDVMARIKARGQE